MKPVLTVLEGKWYSNKNVSTRDLFTPLFAVWTHNPDETCYHEQFTNQAAFCSAISHAFRNHRASTIYVGAHGSRNRIHGFHDAGISRTVIRNSIRQQGNGTRRGLFFGACEFVTPANAAHLLGTCPRLSWIAGYSSAINWTDSSVLDLYFFRHFLFPTPGRGRDKPRTPAQRLEHAVEKVVDDLGPLARRLRFAVYRRRQGGGIVNMIREEE